jgi:branched-chain amino acid transport system substrate-binding protein
MHFLKVVGLAAMSAVCALAIPPPASAQSEKTILIGVHLDRAKQASYYSTLQQQGMDALLKQVNAAGGINGQQVKLLYEDDENNPVVTATKVDKLAAESVSYIISIGSSATGLAAQARANELKIPHGTPANIAESLTSSPPKKYYFRTALRDSFASAAAAQFLKKKYGNPKLAFVRDATETGLILSDQWIKDLKASGFNVVAVEQITPGSPDVTAQALRVRDAKADVVIVLGGSIPDLANYTKAHRTVGNAAPLLGNYLFTSASFIKLTGPASDGFIFTDAVDPARPEVTEIEKQCVVALGESARNQPVMIMAWEYLRLVLDAIKRANSTDHEAVRTAMEQTKGFPIALGPKGATVNYSADSHDLFTGPDQVVFREIRNGQYGAAIQWR